MQSQPGQRDRLNPHVTAILHYCLCWVNVHDCFRVWQDYDSGKTWNLKRSNLGLVNIGFSIAFSHFKIQHTVNPVKYLGVWGCEGWSGQIYQLKYSRGVTSKANELFLYQVGYIIFRGYRLHYKKLCSPRVHPLCISLSTVWKLCLDVIRV